MTDLEKQALEILREVQGHFEPKRIYRETFMEVMGHVRDMIRKLENRYSGCATGLHAGACSCKPAVVGKAVHA